MTKRIVAFCLLLSGVFLTGYLVAGQSIEKTIKAALAEVVPPDEIDNISPSPVEGISEVLIGMSIFYVTNDGKYVLKGNLIDMETRKDLTEDRLGAVRVATIDKLNESTMIIFPAKEQKDTITVFTDIDCGYCRKLHNEIENYNAEGITVRYLSFPRSGPDTPSFSKAVSVWCAEDRNQALTLAKSGDNLPNKECKNPVKDHFNLGVSLGVRGTPAILLEDGTLVPGYLPAKKLRKQIDRLNAAKS